MLWSLKQAEARSFFCTVFLVDKDGNALMASNPVLITVEANELAGKDLEAYAALQQDGLWRFTGPHALTPTLSELETLQDLSTRYASTRYGPYLECGLAFAGVPEDADARIEVLQGLGDRPAFPFAKDCWLEAGRLYLEMGDAAKARALYPRLLEGELPQVWRAAIAALDPDWHPPSDSER